MAEPEYLTIFNDETEESTTWPNPNDPLHIQHRLRYGPPLNREEMLIAASIVDAYRALVFFPRRVRERRISEMRKALVRLEELVS